MHVEQLKASAQDFQSKGETESSLSLWQQILALEPEQFDALIGAAADCTKLGKLESAQKYYLQLLKTQPGHVPTQVALAKLYQSLNNYADAAKHWKLAMERKPQQPNFTLFYIKNLIQAQNDGYQRELEICDQQLAQHQRGYSVIANELSRLGDVESERDLLQRGCLNAKLPEERFRLARRLVKLLWTTGKTEAIQSALDAVYLQDGNLFLNWLVLETYAIPLIPAEANWLCSNEPRILCQTADSADALQPLFARAWLWSGEKSTAIERFSEIRTRLLPVSEAQTHTPENLLHLIEASLETAEPGLAEKTLLKLIAIVELNPETKLLRYLVPFVSILSVNGYEHIKILATRLIEQYLAPATSMVESSSTGEVNTNDHSGDNDQYAFCLADIAIKCGLNKQAVQLFERTSPQTGHWLAKWVTRNCKYTVLSEKATAWNPHGMESNYGELKFRSVRAPGRLPNGSIPLFTKFKNEEKRIPEFLNYYRRLGVTHFFMIDNDSSDGALDDLLNAPDVYLYSAPGSLESNRHCVPWINGLIDEYSDDHWCVHVDVDEYMDFVGSEMAGSLSGLVAKLEKEGAELLPAFMLDMYPETTRDIRSPQAGEEIRKLHPWFDSNYRFLGMRGAPYMQAVGGFRARMWPGLCADVLNKVPLFKSTRGVRSVNANHDTNGGLASQKSAALRHYRLSDDVYRRRKFSDYISKTNSSLANLQTDGDPMSLLGPNSVRYESSEQLLSLGLINV